MTEKSYYAKIAQYYESKAEETTAWEVKFTRTKYINFKCLAPHQEEKLLQSERTLSYKIPDSGINQKPFDGVTIVKGRPVFVAIYYSPRDAKVYEIPIRLFLKEKYTSGNKSLKEDRAMEIGKEIKFV